MNPEAIERMIEQGRDSYEARLAAGQARLKRGEIAQAASHLERATGLAPDKTMAWQSLGEAYRALGRFDDARAAWDSGIEVAERNGDQQAAKVMRVWRKRLDKQPALPDPKRVFAEGRLLALPTETVYGLAAPIDQPELIARVFELKGRPADHPLIVHVATIEQARSCVADWSEAAEALSKAFWPGPLTLVLPKSKRVDATITAGQDTVALRMPDHPRALALIQAAGVPWSPHRPAPSRGLSPTRAADVAAVFSAADVEVVDGGPCRVGIESTIVALDSVHRRARLLRPGMVSQQALSACLPPGTGNWRRPQATGSAPRVRWPSTLAQVHPLRVEVLADESALAARFDALAATADQAAIRLPRAADLAAQGTIAALRHADQAEAEVSSCCCCPRRCLDPAWVAIINRLRKAGARAGPSPLFPDDGIPGRFAIGSLVEALV